MWRDDIVLPAFFFKIVKSNPVPLQLPEVLGALQTNRAYRLLRDPRRPSPRLRATSGPFARLTTMLDFPLTVVLGGTVMGQKQWDSLTPEQKTIMTETSAQFHALARKNLRADEEKALISIKEHNIKVLTPSEADKAEWIKVGAQVRQALTGQIADQALSSIALRHSVSNRAARRVIE